MPKHNFFSRIQKLLSAGATRDAGVMAGGAFLSFPPKVNLPQEAEVAAGNLRPGWAEW